jgi:diguanylate cyclase (GGDEF)-like protein
LVDPPDDTGTTAPTAPSSAAAKARPPATRAACLVVIAGPSMGEMYRLDGARVVLGRAERVDVKIIDDGISREHAAIEQQDGKFFLCDLRSMNGTYCNGERVDRRPLYDGDKIAVGSSTLLKFTFQDTIDEHYQKQLFQSALRDALTGIYNRRYFLDRLHGELRFAVRHGKPLALLFVDVDHFKKVNDSYGHQAGDQVLVAVAEAMTTVVRAEDVLARYGGEEFAILCRETDVAGAEILGKRLCAAVARKKIQHAGEVLPITVSVGVAVDPSLQEPHALIAAADGAMYEAKASGRNRVCVHRGHE